jgi:hypothetical protein
MALLKFLLLPNLDQTSPPVMERCTPFDKPPSTSSGHGFVKLRRRLRTLLRQAQEEPQDVLRMQHSITGY